MTADPLDLLYVRSCTIAERVFNGELPFIEGVDFCYSAAEFGGLVDRYGTDCVQACLAEAFMGVPKGATCTTA